MAARSRSLQLEITANLFVVMLTGLALVAAVMTAVAAHAVEEAALDRLRTDALHLERLRVVGQLRWSDLAAVAQTLPSRARGVHWIFLRGRDGQLRVSGGSQALHPELLEAGREAVRSGVPVRMGGLGANGLSLVFPLPGAGGGGAVWIGTVPREAIWSELGPLLWSEAWVLATAAAVFVMFGAYLLRRRIVVPIQRLQGAMRELASGDLAVRTVDTGADEIAELARGFNHMAESLARDRAALLRAQDSLSRSQRLATVGQLAAGVAHEVGNPVAAILGYAEVALRDPELSARSRPVAAQIRAEALRIRALVRELLDLARSRELELAAESPAGLLERVAARLRSQELLSGVTLRVSCSLELPAVQTDPRRLEQILVNLIENAAHAHGAQAGRGEPWIELSATVGELPSGRRREDASGRGVDAVVFSVCDNGPGIAAADQPHVFDPFYTTKGPGEGTGLGLWNAHRLAELLGGRIELVPEAGRTCFRVLLPCADSPDKAEHDEAPHPDHR